MNSKVKKIVVIGMLVAAQVVAGRFLSISLPIVKIGFAFLPLVIVAMLYGPVWGGVAGAIGDILVAVLGGFGYFPPMTISAIPVSYTHLDVYKRQGRFRPQQHE